MSVKSDLLHYMNDRGRMRFIRVCVRKYFDPTEVTKLLSKEFRNLHYLLNILVL